MTKGLVCPHTDTHLIVGSSWLKRIPKTLLRFLASGIARTFPQSGCNTRRNIVNVVKEPRFWCRVDILKDCTFQWSIFTSSAWIRGFKHQVQSTYLRNCDIAVHALRFSTKSSSARPKSLFTMSSENRVSTATSCKNRQYTQSMKTTFQFINFGFSLLVFILMIVVCFAFSNNVKMIQDVPFIVQTITFQASGVQDAACYYMGLRGMCFAVCGAVTPFYPADSSYRTCNQQSSTSYSQQVSTCDDLPAGAWHVMFRSHITYHMLHTPQCPCLSHITLPPTCRSGYFSCFPNYLFHCPLPLARRPTKRHRLQSRLRLQHRWNSVHNLCIACNCVCWI